MDAQHDLVLGPQLGELQGYAYHPIFLSCPLAIRMMATVNNNFTYYRQLQIALLFTSYNERNVQSLLDLANQR